MWVQPDGVRCAFVHDKIRSALLARLSVEARRDLHWQIALSLQKSFPDRVFDLAYHFDAAGHSERAPAVRPSGRPAGPIATFAAKWPSSNTASPIAAHDRPIGPCNTELPRAWATC